MSAKKQVSFTLNGEPVEALVEPRTHLGDFVRDHLRLTGTHLGCEHGVCGACTVLLDGEPVRSCITYTVACEGREVRTIEGFGDDDALMRRIRAAFTDHHGLQCGFCTPGMLLMSRDICRRLPDADEHRIRVELSGNLCRCTGYAGIVNAVKSVLADVREGRVAVATEVAPAMAAAAAPPLAAFTPAVPVAEPAAALPQAPAAERQGGTRIEDRFVVPHPPAAVWQVIRDPEMAASCLPGAAVTEHDDRSAKGRINIKFGPMSASFAGAATVERDDTAMRAVLKGAGNDSLSGSRARGDIAYQLFDEDGGRATRVEIALDYSLVGPLAQFSRSGLVRDFAGRMIAEFGRNLSARVAAPGQVAARPAELKAGSVFLSVLWHRILVWLGIRQ